MPGSVDSGTRASTHRAHNECADGEETNTRLQEKMFTMLWEHMASLAHRSVICQNLPSLSSAI